MAVSLQADLNNASTQLKIYQVENSSYPTSIDYSSRPAENSICLKSSSSNTYIGFQAINDSEPQAFCLTAVRNNIKYNVTDSSEPQTGSCNNVITDGLVAYYPFNGDAKDYSGNID